MTLFTHVAKERCSLYNRMRGLIRKCSKLFPEDLYLVKELEGFPKKPPLAVFDEGADDVVNTHLIIDGYNLLGAMWGLSDRLESAREDLLGSLAAYRYRRQYAMTVVFDGWRHNRSVEQHERYGGIEIIYSKRGERADQVIQRLARHYGRDCAVVTSDREIIQVARSHGAFVLEAREFAAKLHGLPANDMIPHKELDSGENGRRSRGPEKKGNPRKLPKAERRRQHQLKRF